MALLLAGLPVSVPGETVNRLCASGMTAVATAARGIRSGDGDVYIAGGVESMTRAPYVMSKSAKAVRARRRDLRHEHWLAVREPEDARHIRHRFHGADGRERRRSVRGLAPGPGPVRVSFADQGRSRARVGPAGGGDHPGRARAGKEGRCTAQLRGGRVHSSGHDARGAGQAAARVPHRRQGLGDGRELVRHQRWRVRAAHGIGRRRAAARREAVGPDRLVGGRRRGTADHGDGPGAGNACRALTSGTLARRHGGARAQRGLCCADARVPARAWGGGR